MVEHPEDPSRSGSRGRGLTRDSIVTAALARIDEAGVSALSMRSLAERLGALESLLDRLENSLALHR